jgi:GNAT superfamily N-acetyltransferase
MAIELDSPPPEPRWPEGIAVRTFDRAADEDIVFDVQNETFADMWEYTPPPREDWQGWMFDSQHDPTLWFVVTEGEEAAAIALCRPHETGDPDMGWVSVLGVRRPWRRRGLGLALLRHVFGEFHRRGRKRVGLGVDGSSPTGATQLYERAGMSVDRRWDVYEKESRAG